MHRARLVTLGVVAMLLVALVPAFLLPATARTSLLAQPAPTCELVTNGSFETPALRDNSGESILPPGWRGGGNLYLSRGTGAFGNGSSAAGSQYVQFGEFANLSQELTTTGLDGATLTLTFQAQTFGGTEATVVQLGSASLSIGADESSDMYSTFTLTLTLTSPAPATTALSFSSGLPILDAISVSAVCPAVTPTTEPTATATTAPTRPTATLRPTPRPRLNPTSTPTQVPGEPTTRPTPRPRG